MTGRPERPAAILIAGPTASGKSALALDVAARLDAVIVNADSMQVYRDLRIITARPTPAEEASVPHRLYGHVDAAENYSTGRWITDAQAVLAQIRSAGRVPVLVGGTGLYFKLLTTGIATVPPIPADVRAAVRQRMAAQGATALYAELARRDPDGAARIRPADGSRIVRALEVVEATGRPLGDWQRENAPPVLDPQQALKLFLTPERSVLSERIDKRFNAMLAAGALAEVRALAARGLDPTLPAMKAHGVPWLIRHLRGEISLAEAATQAKTDTRHYTKRQFTWFRNQMPDWLWEPPERALDALMERLP